MIIATATAVVGVVIVVMGIGNRFPFLPCMVPSVALERRVPTPVQG